MLLRSWLHCQRRIRRVILRIVVRMIELLDDENCHSHLLRMSRYGARIDATFNLDSDVVCPSDDKFGWCAKGREYGSARTTHKYTQQERKMLGAYESLEYLPYHSDAYKEWIKRNPPHHDILRWVMMGLIGMTVGFIGFLLHQFMDLISKFKWDMAIQYLDEGSKFTVWLWIAGFSCLLVFLSTVLVVIFRPQAASSGIPELMGFLNGTVVRHIFNIKTLVIKFCSCVLAVASGLPIGPEGPMIHMGSLVGAGLSQFKSDTMKFKLPCFERFRNFEDRRNFISAGAAAGVASAFGAPVGGVLFSMEEVSSFWNMKLTWQIFFCAMISTVTTDLFNSSFKGFRYEGSFGKFKAEEYILFQVQDGLPINILTFIPAAILGVIGGILGALFVFVNLKIVALRRRILAGLRRQCSRNLCKLMEPIVIMIVVSAISVFLPALFTCSPYTCIRSNSTNVSSNCLKDKVNPLHTDELVSRYTCPRGVDAPHDGYVWTNKTYNQMATLMFGSTEKAIHHLFSRNTHLQLDYVPLLIVLVIYFFMAAWASGTYVASGVLVPMLFIGGLYGRLVGLVMVSLFGIHSLEGSYWSWMDPGAFALVGAASFFGGVSRLTMSLAVIMIELTNDVQFLLPIMAAIMVSKWVGDFFTHPYYHALLEHKCIPYLHPEPIVNVGGKKMNLELYSARHVMARPPVVIRSRESVVRLSELLLGSSHGGYPVVKKSPKKRSGDDSSAAAGGGDDNDEVFFGFINRLQLTVILKNADSFRCVDDYTPAAVVNYLTLTLDKLENPYVVEEMLTKYSQNEEYKDLYVDLEPYVNQSAISVPGKFSLERTYIIFRTLGLRHMTVVDETNHVIGIITRKDLMSHNMEERLADHLMSYAVNGNLRDEFLLLLDDF